MNQEERQRLFSSVVRLRRLERKLPRIAEIGAVRSDLERLVGETASQAFAARALGVSHTALGRWLERGDLPSVVNAAGRRAIPVASLADLCVAVEQERAAGSRHALEAVVKRDRSRAERLSADSLLGERASSSGPHRASELRGLAYHRALLRRPLDRAVVNDALSLVRRWRDAGRMDPRYADAWENILSKPIPDIRKALERDDQEARDLRQTSPFAGLLSESERRKILDEVS